ncbi:MAG: RT0821/Lpp0805 family surface protein [Gammaproteobacteria bacterium]|jgi:surface antigen|nr:RT0821/Lpp0805 family surface protein [Gammaproteobacteria bacterium]
MKYWLINLMIVTLLALPATAQNIGFLSKGPIAYLTDEEKALLSETLSRVLENSADGESVTWNNQKSGHNGRIEIIDTHEDYGTTCRTIRTHTMAAGREGGGIYRLCRADDNSWRFAPRRRN